MSEMWDQFADWLLGIVLAVAGYIGDLIMWVWTGVWDWVWSLLPPAIQDFLASDQISGLLGLCDDLSWFIPIYGTIGIIAGTLSGVGIIRLVRYVVSIIPTWIVGDA